MATPVYLLVLAKGYTEAWYQLSKEERDSLWAMVVEIDKRAGLSITSPAIHVGPTRRLCCGGWVNIQAWRPINRR